MDHEVNARLRDKARQQQAATKRINELVLLLRKKMCGQVEIEKPNNVLQLLFENVNSLGVLLTGKTRGQKLKQMRHLLKKWGVDMASFCLTKVEWRNRPARDSR